jgi:hypothetical protein
MIMLPLTTIEGVPEHWQVKPGMAHFANTGPAGTKCGSCAHRGYYKPATRWNKKGNHWEEYQQNVNSCGKYHKLTGKHGPPVGEDWASCKYYDKATGRK